MSYGRKKRTCFLFEQHIHSSSLKKEWFYSFRFYIFCPEWRNIFIYSAAVVAAATAAGPA
jgi:hypothetical protein